MAGMLPGVEAARRRRLHSTTLLSETAVSGTTRRPSFCLYATNHDFQSNSSSSSSMPRGWSRLCDESQLNDAAREAKRRLDLKLQPQWTSYTTKRSSTNQQLGSKHVTGTQSQKKKLTWFKPNWKSSEQEDCAVCLESFTTVDGGALMQLPCAHRFHAHCLHPWLEKNADCPCCRMKLNNPILFP